MLGKIITLLMLIGFIVSAIQHDTESMIVFGVLWIGNMILDMKRD